MKTEDKKLVFLALGSNISPRRQYISQSLDLLRERFPGQFRISALYQTQPFKNLQQPAYINCVVECVSFLGPLEVLDAIAEIEVLIGRKRSGVKWESRVIDIDVLLWGEEVIQFPRLTVPHYDLCNRDFFLVPLLELNNTLVHPASGRFLVDILGSIPEDLKTHPEVVDAAG